MLPASELIARLHSIRDRGLTVAFDVEGQEWMTCCGFGLPPVQRDGIWHYPALVIDTLGLRGQPHSAAVWQALRGVLESDQVKKVCWNAANERGFLQWVHSITLRNYEDAMFRSAERWPELRKRLKYMASLLTHIPCWTEGISWNEDAEEAKAEGERLWVYNAWDNVATLQLWNHPQLQLSGRQEERYRLHLSLIEPLNYASQKGILYDQARADQIRTQLTPRLWEAQAALDQLAGHPLPRSIIKHCLSHLCKKREGKGVTTLAGCVVAGKKSHVEHLQRIQDILGNGLLTPARRGELGSLLGTGLNAESPDQCSSLLTRLGLKLKPTTKRKPNHDHDDDQPSAPTEPNLTTKSAELLDAFIRLGDCALTLASSLTPSAKATKLKSTFTPEALDAWKVDPVARPLDPARLRSLCTAILRVRSIRGQLGELDRGLSSRDGRIRCMWLGGYGTESNRTTCKKWLDGAGGNLQTVPKEPLDGCYFVSPLTEPPTKAQATYRHLYRPDPGWLWWKVDLTGADLWTVACRCASLGDRTMLDDLLAGIRIPSLVGLALEHGYRPSNDRAQVRDDCKAYRASLKARGEKWKDTLWKKASHLTNYGGKPKRIRQGVIEDTYQETGTPFDPGLDLCVRTQDFYLHRYWGLPKWWRDTESKIMRTGRLEFATGQVREFLSKRPYHGRLDDETLREALAAEPQTVTTLLGCNLPTMKLWADPTNWCGPVGEGEWLIPTMLHVHDEAAGQCHASLLDQLPAKIKAAYHNPITIGRITIDVPWEGAMGPSWGECTQPLA